MEGEEEFSRYDTNEYLMSEADVATYLNEAIAEEDPKLLSAVLDDIAKVRSMGTPSPDTE
ncbi:helix-turn-helix domain-containing transcriptional regulator [Aeromonas rivipollensis]|uniref:helix-turn-helix domain-containing transcriptional regulator n=1 Tax=Aeromonas rivipollensis TaxID=948519 RepID=UPI0038D09649